MVTNSVLRFFGMKTYPMKQRNTSLGDRNRTVITEVEGFIDGIILDTNEEQTALAASMGIHSHDLQTFYTETEMRVAKENVEYLPDMVLYNNRWYVVCAGKNHVTNYSQQVEELKHYMYILVKFKEN